MSITAFVSPPSPDDGLCGLVSNAWSITLSGTLGIAAVFTVTTSVGGDTITSSPVTIPIGQTSGAFTITPATCGSRTITISTSTSGVVVTGSTATYTSDCNCPSNSGGNAQSASYTGGLTSCPSSTLYSFTLHPSGTPQLDLYCTSSPITMVLTE